MTAALVFEGLTVVLGGRTVLSNVTAEIPAGRFTAICGRNGAGKTTLLRAALGLARPAAGRVMLAGDDTLALSPPERARRVGYLPQERRVAWGVPALRIAALGAATATVAEAEARGRAALDAVGLAAFADRSVFEMSGGERARVLLARLFATDAPLLILDEPAAGLDPEAQLLVLDLLKERVAAGATVVATLHDLGLAARCADRVLVLDGGRVAAEGPPLQALAPDVLRRAFALDGSWIDTPGGPLLAARRTAY